MSKTMAEVLAEHPEPDLDNGYWYCMCGHDYGVNFTTDSIATHQQDMLEAAGFGLVADAKAEALEEAVDDFSVNLTVMSGPRIRAWLSSKAAKYRAAL